MCCEGKYTPMHLIQHSLWTKLHESNSEKFFQEIYNHFQTSQQEIKNMGLVIQQEGDLVLGASEAGIGSSVSHSSPQASSGRSKPLVTQLSFDTRDLQVKPLQLYAHV